MSLKKSAQDKIKKYSGIADSVKSTKVEGKPSQTAEIKTTEPVVQEEPRITKEQVIEAFQSFGFEPNEKNNDIQYWVTRPASEISSLTEELYNQRKDFNTNEDSLNKSKETLPRLSDEDITSLFDEYG